MGWERGGERWGERGEVGRVREREGETKNEKERESEDREREREQSICEILKLTCHQSHNLFFSLSLFSSNFFGVYQTTCSSNHTTEGVIHKHHPYFCKHNYFWLQRLIVVG